MEKVDITKHSYVPKHIKISEDEKKQLLEKYNITMHQLPKIYTKDPAIRDLNVKVGDIIKIIRSSPTNKEITFYRAVING